LRAVVGFISHRKMPITRFGLRAAPFLCFAIVTVAIFGQNEEGLTGWWRFDETSGSTALDSISQAHDQILNAYSWTPGVSGHALKFDGFTTVIKRAPDAVPASRGEITIEAWLALHSYPWNWVPIVDHEKEWREGYYFGIDAEGRLGFQVGVWNDWEILRSEERLPLMQWVHVAGTYDQRQGLRLYVNGKPSGALQVTGRISLPEAVPFQIGRNIEDLPPTSLIRAKASLPALYSLDGLLDDLRVYDRPLSGAEVKARYDSVVAPLETPLMPRKWPTLSVSKGFGAAYCDLKLYPEWDALWRTGPFSDVVVHFERTPVHYVFWRGGNYGESLVTENGIWIGDQSFESGTHVGTAEHMNDKHNLHASITIVENSPARVVLHWRYGLVDIGGQFSHPDPSSGWGDWADEYFYIYPDQVSVRYGTIHGNARHYSFTEPTVLLEPGAKAENFISLEAATIANVAGETRTYNWDPNSPAFPFPDQPKNANIALLNTKSQYKPFYVYPPGTELGPYGWPPELRLGYSHFPTWDHWPVNQIPSDGRFELFPDHYGSAAIMSPEVVETPISGPDPTRAAMFLFGLTSHPILGLVPAARSWLRPPEITLSGNSSAGGKYDAAQRAYVFSMPPQARDLTIHLAANEQSPAFHPAFVIQSWGDGPLTVSVNGRRLPADKYRYGHIYRLDRTDLIVWLDISSPAPLGISVSRNPA
jgi:Concanavalin A-like lectin/glucanases superfamily